MFNFNCSMKLKLPVNNAVIDYLGNIDTRVEWEARSISAHKRDRKLYNLNRKQVSDAVNFISTPLGKAELEEYMNECLNVFSMLIKLERNKLFEYLGNKKFVFIIGIMRSGGTYLFTELCNITGIKWKHLNMGMLHDNIPDGHNLSNWDKPMNYLNTLFELAQFLVWAKKEYTGSDIIVQKRVMYAFAMNVIDNVFGDRAKYVITVRHPGPASISFAEFAEDIEYTSKGWFSVINKYRDITRENWESMDYRGRYLIFWQVYYENIVRTARLKGEILTAAYERQSFDNVLNRLAVDSGKDYKGCNFKKVTNRTCSDFWSNDKVKNSIQNIKRFWNINGYEFPDIKIQ